MMGGYQKHNGKLWVNIIRKNINGSQCAKKLESDENFKTEFSRRVKNGLKQYFKTHVGHFTNHQHTLETKQKMSLNRKGKYTKDKNPAFGKHWWTDPVTGESSLFKDNEVPEGWIKGRKNL